MTSTRDLGDLLVRSRRLAVIVIGLALLVLAAAIALTTRQIRSRIRDQIIGRDAAVLHAVLQTQLEQGAEFALDSGAGLDDPTDELTAVLMTSRLKGVMGTRLFNAQGQFVESFPPSVRETDLAGVVLDTLRQGRPLPRFFPHLSLDTLFYPINAEPEPQPLVPLLIVDIPLQTPGTAELAGAAQFLIEGETLAAELARLDQHLFYQAGTAFLAGGVMLTVTLSWAFGRLRRTQRALSERTENLLRANEELARAARTTALGAVTSHLIHGLKSPLAGLQSLMASYSNGPGPETAVVDWQAAETSMRRMQAMITRVVNVLHETEMPSQYEVSIPELCEAVHQQLAPLARERGITVRTDCETAKTLTNRTANLAGLILANLLENALQATGPGGEVRLQAALRPNGVRLVVEDQGPGVPESVRDDPFAPRRSPKEGGSGIGLAISRQLATHLGASLSLEQSSVQGSRFVLVLPDEPRQPTAERSAAAGAPVKEGPGTGRRPMSYVR